MYTMDGNLSIVYTQELTWTIIHFFFLNKVVKYSFLYRPVVCHFYTHNPQESTQTGKGRIILATLQEHVSKVVIKFILSEDKKKEDKHI